MRLTDNIAYGCWENMIQRCTNPNAARYNRYGGRGISVCEKWRSFAEFIADLGPRPSKQHSLDRINNDGNYEPGNVKWSTHLEQAQNKQSNAYALAKPVVEKHRRQWRFVFKKKRYYFKSEQEAIDAKMRMYEELKAGNY